MNDDPFRSCNTGSRVFHTYYTGGWTMHIYFLRHGIAEEDAAGGDAARRLTKEGLWRMQAEGKLP